MNSGLAGMVIAPLGFCQGAFMPIGLSVAVSVTEKSDIVIAWGWAVNGFFSVTGSILSTMLGMIIGFDTVFLSAGIVYMIGITALMTILSVKLIKTGSV